MYLILIIIVPYHLHAWYNSVGLTEMSCNYYHEKISIIKATVKKSGV